jgi:hypothetical protein
MTTVVAVATKQYWAIVMYFPKRKKVGVNSLSSVGSLNGDIFWKDSPLKITS